jgi:hypothetical protein
MKGYIYRLYGGADPGAGWIMNDPIFGKPPTLGGCVPNIRALVERGDWIFCISGNTPKYQPYIVGGMEVAEKIDALVAHARYPQYRMKPLNDRQVHGNILVDSAGKQHELDTHTNFDRRLENYIVGRNALVIQSEAAVERARQETLRFLSGLFDKSGNRVFDIIGRWRKLDEKQVGDVRDWIKKVNEGVK